MKNIYLNIFKPNLGNIKKAKKNLENNNVIGIPTETVYGLGGNAYSNKAVQKIFKLKKRSNLNPLIIHFKNASSLKNDVIINKNFRKLYRAFCPGPITFILNKTKNSKISKIATVGKKTIAIRIPKHNVAKNLLNMLNFPIAAPSANISLKLSPTSAIDVIEEFGKKINFVLDGGQCKIGLESTIIDLTGKPIILRPGYITPENIEKILKQKIKIKKKFKTIKSPGQFRLHYSPGIPVYLNKKKAKKNQALIGFGKNFKKAKNHFNLSNKGSLKEAAINLYRIMRKIKKNNFKSIAVVQIPNKKIGLAINDRLKKASNK
ncbi:MAG: L-threonylcarbamoyladenylate synthase [Pelagibacterales bacterium]|nr:L-threonylcarbamoyladenylate synthase [Pelagibacterales bacterium]